MRLFKHSAYMLFKCIEKYLIHHRNHLYSTTVNLTILFLISILLQITGLFEVNRFIDLNLFVLAVTILGITALKIHQKTTKRALAKDIFKYVFMMLLVVQVFKGYFNIGLLNEFTYLVLVSTFAIITFYEHRQPILAAAEVEQEILEQKRKKEFVKKFSKVSRVPFIRGIIRWMYKEGWGHSGVLIIVFILFLGFGTHHLGQFMSVDEPKWLEVRVPQLYDSVFNQDWEKTYINDKPGVLPSVLAGIVNFFYHKNDFGPQSIEYYLFLWRLPILLFNAIMLVFIYSFTKKLFNKNFSLLCTSMIALNPIIIGISQIVNPDATLWSTGFLAFLSFFLYLKYNQRKYIYYSGIFFGLALISKYFISIYYLIFFIAIIIDYLQNKSHKIGQLYARLYDLALLYLTSIITYCILFPVTWVRPQQLIEGTIGASILKPGHFILMLMLFLFFVNLIIFDNKIIEYVKKINLLHYLMKCLALLVIVTISLLLYTLYDSSLLNGITQTSSNIFTSNLLEIAIKSSYTTLITLTTPLLLGMILFPLYVISLKKDNQSALVHTSLFFIIIFILGASLGRYIVSPRYQIVLYPFYSILATYVFLKIIKGSFRQKVLTRTIIFIQILTVLSTAPFYYHHNNFLNIHNMVVTDAWGYGGYELAQIVNAMPNATNLNIWSDREGFNKFFIGNTRWRGKDDPFDSKHNNDYLVLTAGGHNIFKRAFYQNSFYGRISKETPLLSYYDKMPEKQVCINNNPNNCVRLVKVDKSDLR